MSVLPGVLAPAAALAGIGWRTRRETEQITAEKQIIADTRLEHLARGERARIAGELHDVVAHHISMVVVQAETARLATPGMPEEGAERLKRIGDTARAALTEMRRLLGVLREDAEAVVAVREPQPGLGELARLVEEAREVGGDDIRLITTGEPAPSTRAWNWPPTASSRRRSPTHAGTRRVRPWTSSCAIRPRRSSW
ncbi:sensor histidine kinase [Thermocatellispora tengchongensis]|uniref:sensor histidine kinase n=1 Tax=Thermocatellispora tengchongensis TaxID=1073253 RepID=UPI003632F955